MWKGPRTPRGARQRVRQWPSPRRRWPGLPSLPAAHTQGGGAISGGPRPGLARWHRRYPDPSPVSGRFWDQGASPWVNAAPRAAGRGPAFVPVQRLCRGSPSQVTGGKNRHAERERTSPCHTPLSRSELKGGDAKEAEGWGTATTFTGLLCPLGTLTCKTQARRGGPSVRSNSPERRSRTLGAPSSEE